MPLGTDGIDYWILKKAVQEAKGRMGALCEIGTRTGGSAKIMIDEVLKNEDYGRNMLCIDPWGDISYICDKEGDSLVNYSNSMRNQAMIDLYSYVLDKNINLIVLNMEDLEFFNRFSDGFPFYQGQRVLVDRYALVYVDGPHSTSRVMRTAEFFLSRASAMVFDDLGKYNYNIIHDYLLSNRWRLEDKTDAKAYYRSN